MGYLKANSPTPQGGILDKIIAGPKAVFNAVFPEDKPKTPAQKIASARKKQAEAAEEAAIQQQIAAQHAGVAKQKKMIVIAGGGVFALVALALILKPSKRVEK